MDSEQIVLRQEDACLGADTVRMSVIFYVEEAWDHELLNVDAFDRADTLHTEVAV